MNRFQLEIVHKDDDRYLLNLYCLRTNWARKAFAMMMEDVDIDKVARDILPLQDDAEDINDATDEDMGQNNESSVLRPGVQRGRPRGRPRGRGRDRRGLSIVI